MFFQEKQHKKKCLLSDDSQDGGKFGDVVHIKTKCKVMDLRAWPITNKYNRRVEH